MTGLYLWINKLIPDSQKQQASLRTVDGDLANQLVWENNPYKLSLINMKKNIAAVDTKTLVVKFLANGTDPGLSRLTSLKLVIQLFLVDYGLVQEFRNWYTDCIYLILLDTCRLITSKRVAGVLETYWTQSWPSSVHSLIIPVQKIIKLENPENKIRKDYRGGKIEFRISSVCVVCFSALCLRNSEGLVYSCQRNKERITQPHFSCLSLILTVINSPKLEYDI